MSHRSITAHVALAALLHGILNLPSAAQPAEQEKISSMQWINASSVPSVKFTLLGDVVADPWRQGGQTGAGPRSTLQWAADFTPASGGGALKESFELQANASEAGVLVGDFKQMGDAAAPEKLSAGFSKSGEGKLQRCALLRFPISGAAKAELPFYLVNGDPENRVKVTVGTRALELQYAVPQVLKVRSGEHVKLKVSAPGLDQEMGFTFEPSMRGGVLGFYRSGEAGKTSFVAATLRSIESVRAPETTPSGRQ